MKRRELKEVLGMVTRVLSDPRLDPGQRDRVRKAQREFTKICGGQFDRDVIFRATELFVRVIVEILDGDDDTRWPQ